MSDCKHEKVVPVYDEEKAKTMTAREIRKTYPRFDGECPDCKQRVIVYASFHQYIAGDY